MIWNYQHVLTFSAKWTYKNPPRIPMTPWGRWGLLLLVLVVTFLSLTKLLHWLFLGVGLLKKHRCGVNLGHVQKADNRMGQLFALHCPHYRSFLTREESLKIAELESCVAHYCMGSPCTKAQIRLYF